jgi:hypothetical protein
VLVVLAGCVPLPEYVTPDVNGLVIDKATRAPVPQASISLLEHPKGPVQSDAAGKFFLKRQLGLILAFPLGDYVSRDVLRVEKEGYQPASVEIFGWPPQGPVDATIELEPADRE